VGRSATRSVISLLFVLPPPFFLLLSLAGTAAGGAHGRAPVL